MAVKSILGYCPICEGRTIFEIHGPWYRDELLCEGCGSIPRERALATVLNRVIPSYKKLAIHESSPVARGISLKLKNTCKKYIASQYYPATSDAKIGEFFNINLEKQSFSDESFDIFIALDVMEHIFDPESAIKEIYRTLKPDGYAFMTFPINKAQVKPLEPRAELLGFEINYIKEPEFHGNPIDSNGSLVTVEYGYEIHQEISRWAPLDVEIIRFSRNDIGVIGEFTEVIVCKKSIWE